MLYNYLLLSASPLKKNKFWKIGQNKKFWLFFKIVIPKLFYKNMNEERLQIIFSSLI